MRSLLLLFALSLLGAALAADSSAGSSALAINIASVVSPVSGAVATPAIVVDRVVATTPVPDAVRKVGDTRLLARGDAVVVQTLLSTKMMSRVVAEIRIKEEKNWPDGQPGADARVAYIDALTAARDVLEKRVPVGPEWIDRRQRLLIEFAADPVHASFTIGTFEEVPRPDQPGPATREVFTHQEVSRDYVLHSIRLIVADSFRVDEKEADRIGPLAPAVAPVPAPTAAPAAAAPARGPRH